MDYSDFSLYRRQQIVRASEEVKKFDGEMFDFLCNFESDDYILTAVNYLIDGFSIEQVDFLVLIEKKDYPQSYELMCAVKNELQKGVKPFCLRFVLRDDYSLEQKIFLTKVYNDPKYTLLIDNRLSVHAMSVLKDNIQKVSKEKIERFLKALEEAEEKDFEYPINDDELENLLLQAVFFDNFSDKRITAFVELISALNSKDSIGTIQNALKEIISISKIRSLVKSRNFKTLRELTFEAKKKRLQNEDLQKFDALCAKFNDR